MKGKRGDECDIDLGLAVSALSLKYGQTRSQTELAAYCKCSQQLIGYYEKNGLRKLRKAILSRAELQELARDAGFSIAAEA